MVWSLPHAGTDFGKLAEEVHEDTIEDFQNGRGRQPNTPSEFGIMSIPTLIFKKDGQVVKQVVGVHTKEQLKAIVAELS